MSFQGSETSPFTIVNPKQFYFVILLYFKGVLTLATANKMMMGPLNGNSWPIVYFLFSSPA